MPTARACAALLLVGAAWGTAFGVFERTARAPAPALLPEADGIVALTGGADRIETALRLLQGGHAPALLVSGVGRGVDLAEMMRRVRLSPSLEARITLGRQATSTLGNAAETAQWARAAGVRRLLVVTAGYHMDRALLEIGRSLPEVALVPVPVQPPALRGTMDMETTRILAAEFDKYLVALFGPSIGLGRREEGL